MSERQKSKRKKNTYFWRACRYLIPYRWMILLSIVSALFVGVATTGGLGTMLPILRVLMNGDTVQDWIYRQNVEHRLGVMLAQDPDKIEILQFNDTSPARDAGIKLDDVIKDVPTPPNTPPNPFEHDSTPALRVVKNLRSMAWTGAGPLHLIVYPAGQPNDPGHPITVQMPAPKAYAALGLRWIEKLPIQPFSAIAVIFGILVMISVVGNGIRYFQEHYSDKAAILAVNDIRRQLYDRILHIPLRFFSQQGTSDVTSRLVSDAANLQDGFKTVLGPSIQEPIKAAMALGFSLFLSWKLTLFIVAFGPLMMMVIRKFGKKMRRASRAALQSSSVMLGQVESTMTGIRVVKGASAERFERRGYMRIMGHLVLEQLRMSRIDAISSPVMEALTTLIAGSIMLYAAYMVLVTHTLKPEVFIMVMASLLLIADSLRRVAKVNTALQKANAAAERIFETMDTPVERRRAFNARTGNGKLPIAPPLRKLPLLQREIRFQNLTFSYPNAASPAIDGLDLVVPKGQSIAIVGHNGSGKTTLLALLPRYFDPDSGKIFIDGIDIQTVTLSSLRKQISTVTQDSMIFPGTIAENIAYGNQMAGLNYRDSSARRTLMEDIEQAARRAFAHDFIMERPAGYQTHLGEMGGQLSGGQKQRICIARAILRKSPILVLDEATSQIDAESENLIQQAIENIMHERTTFVIAHRLNTIISADSIVVMKRGKIVGQGKHDQLLATCDTYQQLYERQLFTVPAGQ